MSQPTFTVPVSFRLASQDHLGILLDFDLSKSLTIGGQGNYLLALVLTAAATNSSDVFSQLTNCVGTVSALGKDNSSFDIQLLDSGLNVHIVTDTNTFYNPTVQKFSNIIPGEILELTAQFKSDGSYSAKIINAGAAHLADRTQGVVMGTYLNPTGQTVVSLAAQN